MMQSMKKAILTDFDSNQFDTVERCAARMGIPLATWVGHAVTRALGARGTSIPDNEAREMNEPHDGKNQVRIRIEDKLANKLLIMSEDLGGMIGVSTLVREIALAATGEGEFSVASQLWEIITAAKRRTSALR